jgi:hypothetical protein
MLPAWVIRVIELTQLPSFLYVQRVKGFQVPSAPHFDSESTDYFTARLRAATSYLEFGSGGSTVLAAREGKRFVTVDSDTYFLKAVRDKIRTVVGDVGLAQGRFIPVDIGCTQGWGVPIFRPPTSERLKRWKRYFLAPWEECGDSFAPELILIDGRFRVACALATIQALRDHRNWEICVDDYLGRAYYREIELFARLDRMVGRMAVFKPLKESKPEALQEALERYSRDWR